MTAPKPAPLLVRSAATETASGNVRGGAKRAPETTPDPIFGTPETAPGWWLHHGDCLAGLRALPDRAVDVVITDPPYDEHTHKAGRRGHIGAAQFENRGRAKRGSYNRVRELGFDPLSPQLMADVACEFARLCRRWVAIFCSLEMIAAWRSALEAAGLQYIRTCLWHKIGCTPQFTGDRPATAAEAIVLAHRPGRKRWNGGGRHGFYEEQIVLNRNGVVVRVHTTQKPLALMEQLVADFSNPGELVCDPFMGSGSTGVACRQLDRRFLGWELDRDYFDIACRRLRGERARPNPKQPELDFG